MRVILFFPVVFLLSCSGSSEKDARSVEDSLIHSNEVKIQQLERSGDSIEEVNKAGAKKVD
jgi:hypothetical protein